MSYADTLHRASWRGVPFALEMGAAVYGRRKVEHVYPYRDTVWLEDQGQLPPRFNIAGFLIGNSAVYGGGDLQSQLKRMQDAAEAKGAGILVHPTRGRLTVDLLSLVINEKWEDGNVAELTFSFVQGGQSIFPAILGALSDLVGAATELALAAGATSFATEILGPLGKGLATASLIASTADQYIGQVRSLVRDATSLYGTVSQLGGADYGRYFNGRNAGFLSGLSSPYAGAQSVNDLIQLGAANRAAVDDAATDLRTAIGGLGVTHQAVDVAGAAQSLVDRLRVSAADPADGVRLLSQLAVFTPIGSDAATSAGQAVTDLFRRASAAQIATVSAAYAPSSADDAHAVRTAVLAPIDAVIARAGDIGDDAVFSSYKAVRKAVVDDLGQRGSGLARLVEVDVPRPLPDVVLAQMRYADASRAPELLTQADPVHPWFMPTRFQALAS